MRLLTQRQYYISQPKFTSYGIYILFSYRFNGSLNSSRASSSISSLSALYATKADTAETKKNTVEEIVNLAPVPILQSLGKVTFPNISS
mmetsp:Transcript_1354/g.2355  ORF Transcript_1354/g.2355 Transcript_1354/m.2355 type:complete len:89 (-) Transcript_1354:265-531(-)